MTAIWAAGYAAAGWRVFPIVPGQKRPVYSGWQKDATTDPAMCQQYWPEALNRNIAAVCGETFDAWDIEVEHLPALRAHMQANGYHIPPTPVAQTGRGGMHILTQPTGVNGTRYLYLDGVHIGELKSTGGFILLCPSVTTGQYSWRWAPDHLTVQPAPAWLLGLLERPRTGIHLMPSRVAAVAEIAPRLTSLGRSIISVSETHQRNDYLFWAMRRSIEEGIPPKIAQEALLDAYLSVTFPNESVVERRHEGLATINSALRAEAIG